MVRRAKKCEVGRVRRLWRKALYRVRRRVPAGARTLLGLLLIVGGVFGFLPILGFWMIPLGIAIVSLDLRSGSRVWRRWRKG